MRNYELVEQLYQSLLKVKHYGPCHSSDIVIDQSIKMIEKERPELKKATIDEDYVEPGPTFKHSWDSATRTYSFMGFK